MINLLPPDIKSEIKFARINVVLVQYCVAVGAFSVLMFAIIFWGSTLISAQQNELQSNIDSDQVRVAELQSYHNEAKVLADAINTIDVIFNKEVLFSELLTEIGSTLPSGAAFTGLTVSEDRTGPINFDAIVTDELTAAILRENLTASEVFDSADIVSIVATAPQTIGGQTYNYTVSLQVFFAQAEEDLPQLDIEVEEEPLEEGGGAEE